LKRILFFMHTTSQIGGVETWLDRAHAHLSANGFEVIVGLVRGQRYNDPTRYKAYHPEIKTIEVDGRGLNREGRVRALMRCIRKLRPDIVVPLGIVDANEAVIRCKQAGDQLRLLARAQGNLTPMLADLASYREWIDLVVCPGRLTSKVLVEWAGFAPERVLNISNGADQASTPQIPRQQGSPLRVGYVGRLSRSDKRALDLIGLHRELEQLGVDYRLDIVGDGPCHAELQAAFASGAARVSMHGATPHAELYSRVFPNLDVLVMTSASEAFGIVLVEAMMHGVVPISSRYDGFHAEGLVIDGDNGLSFAVGDMQAAAQAIAGLADDAGTLRRMAVASKARAENYSWTRSLQRWEVALDDLLKQKPVMGQAVPVISAPASRNLLDRLGLPAAISDPLRRLRRAIRGPAIVGGGEEWPLFYRHHSAAHLHTIAAEIDRLDAAPFARTECGSDTVASIASAPAHSLA